MKRRRPVTKVPAKILVPILQSVCEAAGRTVENLGADDWARVWRELGPDYSHLDDATLIRQAGNFRRRGLIGAVSGGHGAGKYTPPAELADYYETHDFKQRFEAVAAAWGNRCADCNKAGPLKPFHRTTERLGNELPNDFHPLCTLCCKAKHKRLSKTVAAHTPQPAGLF